MYMWGVCVTVGGECMCMCGVCVCMTICERYVCICVWGVHVTVSVCVCTCVVCEFMWDVVRMCGHVHICEVCVCCEGVCGCELV